MDSLGKRVEKELRRMWSESDTQMIMVVVDEELGKRAQKIDNIIKDTKVDILGMFCYQGPPSKHWIETKGQFWEGWNKACDKISEKLEGLLVESQGQGG